MGITEGYTTATVTRAYAEGATAGVYTWPSFVNTALVTNTSGQLSYIKLLQGKSVVTNPYSAREWATVVDNIAGMFTGTSIHYDTAVDPGPPNTLTQRVGTLVVGKDYVVAANITPKGITSGDQRFTLGTGGNLLSFDDMSGRSYQVAACGAATTLLVTFNTEGIIDLSFSVEQVASAEIGEYDLVIPDKETIDITRDGRESIYGFSVWVPDTGVDAKINARGRVTPGRNKIASPP